jgi:hypothetical protein
MMEIFIYGLIALAILVLAAWLVRSATRRALTGRVGDDSNLHGMLEGPGFNLRERIFDPEDYRWLRQELSFPPAAEALARHRKQLALAWLKALRHSFKELVRTPESESPESQGSGAGGWQLLLLTLRFHLLLNCTILVVYLFGPYHRLIPSFSWAGSLRDLISVRLSSRTTVPSRIL